MSRVVTISLEAADVFQILDALESRAEAYEKTASLMKGEYKISEEDALDSFFVPEECRDAAEAEEIAKHFRDIFRTLESQIGDSE